MKAIRFHQFGDPDVMQLEEVPKPQATSGELVVRVHAAGVNPVDLRIREGLMQRPLPIIPGWDVSGVVEEVGSGVTDLAIGDAVYSFVSVGRDGAYAEYIAVPASHVARTPQALTHVEAAAVPIGAMTAWQALFDAAGLSKGQTVLIHAAAGGVGHFAVQLARWKGAKVIGTASVRNAEFLRSLGADEVIDYTTTAFEQVVQDVDVVFDAIGGDTQKRSWGVLRPGGILVSIVGISTDEEAAKRGVRQSRIVTQQNASQLTEIAGLIDAGHVRPVIEKVLPLAEAVQAHKLVQDGHVRGKVVLQVVAN